MCQVMGYKFELDLQKTLKQHYKKYSYSYFTHEKTKVQRD